MTDDDNRRRTPMTDDDLDGERTDDGGGQRTPKINGRTTDDMFAKMSGRWSTDRNYEK